MHCLQKPQLTQSYAFVAELLQTAKVIPLFYLCFICVQSVASSVRSAFICVHLRLLPVSPPIASTVAAPHHSLGNRPSATFCKPAQSSSCSRLPPHSAIIPPSNKRRNVRENVSLVKFKWLATCRFSPGSSIRPVASRGVCSRSARNPAGGVAQHHVLHQPNQVTDPERQARHHPQAEFVVLGKESVECLLGRERRSSRRAPRRWRALQTRRSPPPRRTCRRGRRCAARAPSRPAPSYRRGPSRGRRRTRPGTPRLRGRSSALCGTCTILR